MKCSGKTPVDQVHILVHQLIHFKTFISARNITWLRQYSMTPRSMMLFDATGYLGRIDPTQSYTIDVLTGGIMNITLRATKTTTLGGGRFPDQPSVILKYAPPFVAAVGERLAMTTFRQVSFNFIT
jgi:hypothetical protein